MSSGSNGSVPSERRSKISCNKSKSDNVCMLILRLTCEAPPPSFNSYDVFWRKKRTYPTNSSVRSLSKSCKSLSWRPMATATRKRASCSGSSGTARPHARARSWMTFLCGLTMPFETRFEPPAQSVWLPLKLRIRREY
eukprot:Rmarinus@m.30091